MSFPKLNRKSKLGIKKSDFKLLAVSTFLKNAQPSLPLTALQR